MKQTRLCISAGLLGATIYFVALFSGYLGVILLSGYVLLFEENLWLKRSAVKAVALLTTFSFLSVTVNLIPNAINVVNSFFRIGGDSFSLAVVTNIISAITTVLDFIEKVLFITLGVKAVKQGNLNIPFVDSLINKHLGLNNN